jgi:hypothetical protein
LQRSRPRTRRRCVCVRVRAWCGCADARVWHACACVHEGC